MSIIDRFILSNINYEIKNLHLNNTTQYKRELSKLGSHTQMEWSDTITSNRCYVLGPDTYT